MDMRNLGEVSNVMMNNDKTPVTLRLVLVPLIGAGLCVALMSHTAAAARNAVLDQLREQLTARAVSVTGPEDAGPIEIYIERWSTDAEVARLHDSLVQGEAGKLLPVLQQQKLRAGVMLMPGVQGHGARARTRTPRNLLFAREIVTATGRQVVVASEEHLGVGESGLDARRNIAEFNLIDMRFGLDGAGVGKIATAPDVAFSAATRDLEMKNYAARPARLVDVRSERP
jgi:hypothetical protein